VLSIQIHSFGGDDYEMIQSKAIEDCFEYPKEEKKCWINIDGINKVELEKCLVPLKIHTLILEDIINIGQRPKIEEIDGLIFCVLNMLYFNEKKGEVETEKMSVILGNKMLITIQEDDLKDAFNTVRERLNVKTSRVRQYDIDFLLYALIDAIVDHYFVVMNKLADHILLLEMEIIKDSSKRTLIKINHLRNAIVLMKRSISPVPELIQGIIKTESDWINERSEKYFRDVYDHARQANELLENHRDMTLFLITTISTSPPEEQFHATYTCESTHLSILLTQVIHDWMSVQVEHVHEMWMETTISVDWVWSIQTWITSLPM
jgi:magnesium transporter